MFRQKVFKFLPKLRCRTNLGKGDLGKPLQLISLDRAGKSARFMLQNSFFCYVWWYLMTLGE